eukprot:scaffold2282_cov136-Skeletonema_marinoi.AAC.5
MQYEGCTTQARLGGVCMKHGSKEKRCSSEECTNKVQNGGVCMRHGARVKRKLCSSDGFDADMRSNPHSDPIVKGKTLWVDDTSRVLPDNATLYPNTRCPCGEWIVSTSTHEEFNSAITCTVPFVSLSAPTANKLPMCVKHGAKVNQCNSEGCTNKVVKGGVCIRHGAKLKRCSSGGCTNQVIKEGVCRRHGAKVKLCSKEGCFNHARKGGVCMRHGAKPKVKQCSSGGCKNRVIKGGVCKRHGAYRNPWTSQMHSVNHADPHMMKRLQLFQPATAAEYTNQQDQSRHPPQVILCQLTDH